MVRICSNSIIEFLSRPSKSLIKVCVGNFAFVCIRLVIGAIMTVGLCLLPILLEMISTGLVPPSLPATVLSRSDCDWTGVSLSSLWVMAKSGAARYFESVKIGSPPFNRSLPLGRSWRTAAHAYAHHNHKEKVFGEWVFTCQGTPPVFATQRKTG